MTQSGQTAMPEQLERLRALARIGSAWAATALEQILARPVLTREIEGSDEAGARWMEAPSTGVLFHADGDLRGLVAVLMPPASRDALVRSVLGWIEGEKLSPEAAESALREVGNIVASQTISAIANEMGARILLSIPELLRGDAEAELAARTEASPGAFRARIQSELFDSERELRLLLVLVPEIPKSG